MYKFNKVGHRHELDGKPLMGVTTVLSVISKPMLIQWSANMACAFVKENLKHIGEMDSVLKEARTAHRRKRDKAGEWGTMVHEAIEKTVKVLIEENEGYCHGSVLESIDETSKLITDFDQTQKEVVRKFFEWAVKNQVTFYESEKHLYSREMWLGGIVDLVFEMDGKKYIGDIKTSSGIYNEAFYQMGAYHLMLQEMGEAKDVEGYLVINLKKDGTMGLKMATDMEMNQTAFKHALGLYKITSKLK